MGVRRLVGFGVVIADIAKALADGDVFRVESRPIHAEVQTILAKELVDPEIVLQRVTERTGLEPRIVRNWEIAGNVTGSRSPARRAKSLSSCLVNSRRDNAEQWILSQQFRPNAVRESLFSKCYKFRALNHVDLGCLRYLCSQGLNRRKEEGVIFDNGTAEGSCQIILFERLVTSRGREYRTRPQMLVCKKEGSRSVVLVCSRFCC